MVIKMKYIKLIALTLFAASILVSGCSESSGPKKILTQYVEAVKSGDFETVYKLNAITQKKVLLIHRGSASTLEQRLSANFTEYKERFKSDPATSDLEGLFMEKYLFPADSKYTIADISVDEVTGSPTPKFKGRKNSSAEISVEYPNKEKAPSFGERKIKSASLGILLIKGEDAVKGLPTDVKVSKWLFKNIHVIRDSIAYW